MEEESTWKDLKHPYKAKEGGEGVSEKILSCWGRRGTKELPPEDLHTGEDEFIIKGRKGGHQITRYA